MNALKKWRYEAAHRGRTPVKRHGVKIPKAEHYSAAAKAKR